MSMSLCMRIRSVAENKNERFLLEIISVPKNDCKSFFDKICDGCCECNGEYEYIKNLFGMIKLNCVSKTY